ncbi:NUDIX hydrolase [Butyrivibrio sp. WCE2006]|uniref:NUDIX hydrolase n=1 Tax=Butyrivibrio sp. WCE2006 TaxID=1410611 RepID=UPI000A46713D|nr:CoA pyrophosphatase [Butyrivibrio sp. WCE2006]
MKTNEIINKIENIDFESRIPRKSSAVIIPLLEISDELNILFEQRSGKLSFQPGEVCFPGGRIEKGESPKNAAIREICEELLLPIDTFKEASFISGVPKADSKKPVNNPEDQGSRILTELSPIIGPTGALIYPFVALLQNYNMTFSSDEVQKVFTYPISFFKDHPPVKYEMQRKTIPPKNFPYGLVTGGMDYYDWHIQHYDMWIYEDTNPVIWGFTGRLLHTFLELL